jgi:hypothetical protein
VKHEVWLETNRRAYLLLAILPAGVLVSCALVGLVAPSPTWWWPISGVMAAAAGWLMWVWRRARLPRLAYRSGTLLIYLRGRQPIQLPIEVVECFFLGQGASLLPRTLSGRHGAGTETATVVVRLAESAKEWSHVEVRPQLGQWCEGYITIRGTWCEPLSGDLVGKLNERLIAAHRTRRESPEAMSV